MHLCEWLSDPTVNPLYTKASKRLSRRYGFTYTYACFLCSRAVPPTKETGSWRCWGETEASRVVRGAQIRSATRVNDMATQKESKPTPPRPWPSIHPAMVLCRYEATLIVDARTETSPCGVNRDRQAGSASVQHGGLEGQQAATPSAHHLRHPSPLRPPI